MNNSDMPQKFLHDETMFCLPAGHYCGVYMPEDVMKKAMKLIYAHESEMRKLLNSNKEKLLVADWTLANKMNGENIEKQITIQYYTEDNKDIDRRIELYKAQQPKLVDKLYKAKSREHANQIAGSLLAELL